LARPALEDVDEGAGRRISEREGEVGHGKRTHRQKLARHGVAHFLAKLLECRRFLRKRPAERSRMDIEMPCDIGM
jgi:hypothetical protein